MRLVAAGFCQDTRGLEQGQEKASTGVRGAPERFGGVQRDVVPGGDYGRDALSRRRHSATRRRAFPSNNRYV